MRSPLFAVLLILLLSSCALTKSVKVPKNAKTEDYFFLQESKNKQPLKWLFFLPGRSGLTVFGDDGHYFRTAEKLNEEGFSVVVVDYQHAYKASGRDEEDTTGDEILWTLEEAIRWAWQSGKIGRNSDISIVGWSLAGEGLALLANDSTKIEALNIKSIAMYYPANLKDIDVKTKLPILIQTGEDDNVVEASEIKEHYYGNENTEIIIYENAVHGYDVESLTKQESIRVPPLIGIKFVFKYNPEAAAESMERLIEFLKQ